jgi:O-antigen/teichoic acid export membrane protein
MLFIMAITLYTVRVVLNNLGEFDFGIFNSIAGIVLTSTFISQTLALSVQRFYSYALGKSSQSQLQDIFTTSSIVVAILSLIIIVLFETIGLWLVNTQLTIPAERITEARWIFDFSLATFILTLLQIPFSSAIFAHEDMDIYAIISAIDCLLKLLVAILISYTTGSRLFFYGAGLLSVASLTTAAYCIIAYRRYPECRFKRIKNNGILSNLISFSGWTMYGNISGVAMIQGSQILLNIFFGPLANAAFGIANQLYNALNSLGSTIVIAFRPAMIKSYAERQYNYLNDLFYTHNKAMFYLLASVAIPLLFEMRPILEWWLCNISNNMVLFSRLFVIYLVLLIMSNPISTIIQATGKIKYYSLIVESITILCIPIAWVYFKQGYSSEYLFYSMIAVCIIAHFARLFCLKRYYHYFSYRKYITEIILPTICCVTICSTITYAIYHTIPNGVMQLFLVFSIAPLVLLSCAYFIGFSHAEKLVIHRFVKQIK